MGQRLNIEIITDEKCLANCYYHWSGYTSSAKYLTDKILDNYKHLVTRGYDDELLAIKLLSFEGAGLPEDEYKVAIEKYPGETFDIGTDRNDGLIAITTKGKNDTREWAEATVVINIKTKTICFDVFCFVELNDMADENPTLEEDEKLNVNHLDILPFDVSSIPFEQYKIFSFYMQSYNNFITNIDGELYFAYDIE